MNEAVNDMLKVLDKLPEMYCEALCLTEIEQYSITDYAKKTGISYTNAKTRVQRARQLLKQILLDCCHYEADKYGTIISISQDGCQCCKNLS
jgi:RNA polymerase sigma-70 factor (ECF subfamily)